MRLLLLAVWMGAPTRAISAEPACAAPVSELALDEALRRAEDAYRALDPVGFETAQAATMAELRCVAVPVRGSVVARVHRLRGLVAFGAGDEALAAAAFAAVRAADPAVGLGDLVPEGHVLQVLFGRAATEGPLAPVPPPLAGRLLVDGVTASARPLDRPIVVQWVDDLDQVQFTAWLVSGDALPPYPAAPLPEPPRPEPVGRRRAGGALILGGTVAGIGAGALLGTAAVLRVSFDADHPEWTIADVQAARRSTNTVVNASVGTGLAAATLLSVGWVLRW